MGSLAEPGCEAGLPKKGHALVEGVGFFEGMVMKIVKILG